MNADDLKKLTTHALDQLAAALDAGHSQQLTAMLKAMGQFHRYSWHNVCLIARQRPDATRVAGFHAWRKLGRFVRKGEKGIAILAPIVRRREDPAEGESRPVVGFRAAYVFDVAQTDGTALPEPARANGDPGVHANALRALVANLGIRLDYASELGGALGLSHGGRIQVLNGLEPANEFMVLAHELGHELLHRDDQRPQSRDTRELEAEAVAFVVAHAVGVEAIDSARDYIHLYRGDREGLAASLTRIQRAASTILEGIHTDDDGEVSSDAAA